MIITVCRLHNLILCEALALRTSGLGLVLLGLDLGLDTVGLVNITA